ncbi:hypothetical protein Tsubulata_032400 [Turnera subulata]|uniref:Stress-response A/B barrel domain-containing protein n=1 Tax=Turnera subulata TaxID=218843 RepID=A0A9Q0F6U4_9ROSI|nr:hypothetical protein Tsubulata_032400 [Turnera subulata]
MPRLAIKDYFGEAVNLLDAKTYQEAQYSAHIGGALEARRSRRRQEILFLCTSLAAGAAAGLPSFLTELSVFSFLRVGRARNEAFGLVRENIDRGCSGWSFHGVVYDQDWLLYVTLLLLFLLLGLDIEGPEMLTQGFSHAFSMTFDKKEDFVAFQSHPNHVEYSASFSAAIEKIVVLCYPGVLIKPQA